MMPGPVDPINIYSQLGGNSSVIIPFRNPTDRQVIVDVIMKERLLSRSGKFIVWTHICFCLLAVVFEFLVRQGVAVKFVIHNLTGHGALSVSKKIIFQGISHSSDFAWLL